MMAGNAKTSFVSNVPLPLFVNKKMPSSPCENSAHISGNPS